MKQETQIYTSIGHGPSPFRPDLFQFRVRIWGFPSEDAAYASVAMLSGNMSEFFEDHDDVPETWEGVTSGEGLRLHVIKHVKEKDPDITPGFTVISEGFETLEECEARKEEFMQEFSELTGVEFMAQN